jgi:hypothetical protein
MGRAEYPSDVVSGLVQRPYPKLERAWDRAKRDQKRVKHDMTLAGKEHTYHDEELRVLEVQKQDQEAALMCFQNPSTRSLSMKSFVSSNLELLTVHEQTAQL